MSNQSCLLIYLTYLIHFELLLRTMLNRWCGSPVKAIDKNWLFHKVSWLFQYLVFSLIFDLAYGDWVTLISNQSRLLIYLNYLIHFELILDPMILDSVILDPVILNPAFPWTKLPLPFILSRLFSSSLWYSVILQINAGPNKRSHKLWNSLSFLALFRETGSLAGCLGKGWTFLIFVCFVWWFREKLLILHQEAHRNFLALSTKGDNDNSNINYDMCLLTYSYLRFSPICSYKYLLIFLANWDQTWQHNILIKKITSIYN